MDIHADDALFGKGGIQLRNFFPFLYQPAFQLFVGNGTGSAFPENPIPVFSNKLITKIPKTSG